MSKAVLISIRPKWAEKIANGEKTIEVRKTCPKLDTPFKCYIYCTTSGVKHMPRDCIENQPARGKVIGEFVCDRIDAIVPVHEPYGIYDISDDYVMQTCLANGALWDYGNGATLYGWRITDLRIYDAPRELGEFERPYECNECDAKWASECNACHEKNKIKHPPQSWCYVEEEK